MSRTAENDPTRSKQAFKRLSKTLAHALRHAPWIYELELDEAGWTDVGSRKAETPLLLHVAAQRAAEAGVQFYIGNELVWLADDIPATFISLPE